ncbi:MAG: hypothetical protein QW726_05375, partial [Fervidicoccaceae archaeon]
NLNVRVLNGYEIANILYSITSLTHSVSFDKNTGDIKEIANYFTKLDTGTISRDKYAKMIKEIDPDQYKVYVATGFIHNELYFDRIIGANWDGTLIITLNFNDMQNTIKKKKGQSMTRLKHIKEMENNLKSGEKVYVGINIHLISKDIEEDTASSVFYSLGFTPIEKRYEKDIYILSALYVRDTDYTFIVEPDQVYKFLIYYYEKTSFPEVADIVGKNRLGSFISYSFFEENNNPHCFIFAPSGAGKSFSMQNMLCNILRISPEQLLTTPVRSDIRSKIRVRYFDKGFSAELLFKLMKERGYPASAFQSNVDSITVNPCDIMNEDSTELDYSVSVVNMCLQATEMLPLTGYEVSFYKKALKEVYKNDEYKSFLEKDIFTLRNIPAFRELYDELLEQNYSPSTKIGEIKDDRYSFLRVPLLQDVIRIMGYYAEDIAYSKQERQEIASGITKLRILADYENLKYPTKINLSKEHIVYIDYEFLSTSRFFTAILITILKRLTYADKFYKASDEYAYYIIDEAHNLLRNEYFNLALNILIREARKYRISMIFLTQNFEDIPPQVIFNADTIMFLSPQEDEKRRAYLTSYYNHIAKTTTLDKERDLDYIYFNSPPYTFTVQYAKGVFSLKLDVDKYKLKLFDSYARNITTDDGIVINKSLMLGEV